MRQLLTSKGTKILCKKAEIITNFRVLLKMLYMYGSEYWFNKKLSHGA